MKLITIDGEAEAIRQFDEITENQYPGADLTHEFEMLEECAKNGETITQEFTCGKFHGFLTLGPEHFTDEEIED